MNITPKYVLFWGSIFSNFANTPYTAFDGKRFFCGEQEFQYRKACLFDDYETAQEILESNNPKEIKALGSKVKGYDSIVWAQVRIDVMYSVCKAKFSGNEQAYDALMSYPSNKVFVEASPMDKVWGIGLGEYDARAYNEETWQGQNLLGRIITKIRDEFIALEKTK